MFDCHSDKCILVHVKIEVKFFFLIMKQMNAVSDYVEA